MLGGIVFGLFADCEVVSWDCQQPQEEEIEA